MVLQQNHSSKPRGGVETAGPWVPSPEILPPEFRLRTWESALELPPSRPDDSNTMESSDHTWETPVSSVLIMGKTDKNLGRNLYPCVS